MSQAAAAMMMNPSSVPQEPSVSASRTARPGSSVQPDMLRDSTGVRANTANDPASRSGPKQFKDVLEKRLPANAQHPGSSENSGDEKSEKKKKTSIQDLSAIALLSMNPALVQTERKTPIQLSVQGGLSEASAAKGSGHTVLPSAPVQGTQRDPYQAVAKIIQGKERLQSSLGSQVSAAANTKDAQASAKAEKGAAETQGQTRQGVDADRIGINPKNQPLQTPESVSAIPLSGVGNPNLNPRFNQVRDGRKDPSIPPAMKSREESHSRADDISGLQEGKAARKLDKNKTPANSSGSQNDNGDPRQLQTEGTLSFSQSQHDARQVTAVTGKADSGTNAVSSADSAATASSPGRQVVQAIREQLAAPAPQQEIQMTLNPPELGKVRIVVQQNNQEITGLLEVEKLRTRADLQRELPQVLLSLQNAGIQIRRLDVVMNNPNGNPSPDQQFGNQAFADPFMDRPDQFHASDSRQDHGHPGSERSLRDFQSSQTPDNADQRRSFIRDDAINVYL